MISEFKADKEFRPFVIIAVITIIVTITAITFDAFEMFYEFSQAHETWELDEIVIGFVFLAFALGFHSFHMFHELKLKNISLMQSENKFRTIFENANDGISIVDTDSHFLGVNNQFCNLLGYRKDELLQMTMRDMEPPEYAVKSSEIMKELDTEGHAVFETIGVCKDGSTVPVELSIRRIEYEGKLALLTIVRDVTSRKKARDELIKAKIAADSANRAKSEFLAMVSHELRTPLNSIIGFSQILETEKKGQLNDEQLQYVRYIYKGGNDLLQIINSILDISQVEGGNSELHYSSFDINDFLNDSISLLHPIAMQKCISLDFDNRSNLTTAIADKQMLKQVLYNLLSNAIKFTDAGGSVKVIVSNNENTLQASVIDTGIGIPKEELESIFLPFKQVEDYLTRKFDGTGLGLTIVKKFVELQGGKVWVESKVGKGSIFTFTIPLGEKVQ
ncbi:ATP-binding protein [Methanolobus sp. ZRKC2]|uniref:PAS domain-containing sensor histidine kinase n=1 Tax=Methanolobus sp. ZRKC2 TaxID=3125783 RepID=UPI00324F315F